MASFGKQLLFWLFLLVLIAPTFTYPVTHVRIYNNLGGDDLTIHCKSKNDDLGTHVIYNNQCYTWKFRINIWESTLFFCGLSWKGGSGVYDIYKARRDYNKVRCMKECDWFVTKDGIEGYTESYPFYSRKHERDIVFEWQNKT